MSTDASDRAFRTLEAMLVHIHRKEDMPALVATLRQRFHSADAMFAASAHVLQKCGLNPRDALLLSHLSDITRYVRHAEFREHPNLCCLQLAAEYLFTNFLGLQVEHFYILCLNARGRLMENIFLQEGTVDGALFDVRHMLAEVVRVMPAAVVLSHNHPMGTMRPSQQDILCTQDAMRALDAIGIPLLDHVILAGKEPVSMRENGFIPSRIWAMQRPDMPLLQKWLDAPPPNAREKNYRHPRKNRSPENGQ